MHPDINLVTAVIVLPALLFVPYFIFFFSSFPFSLSFPRVLLGMHLGSFGIPRLTCTPVLLFYYLSLDIADLQGYE